MPTDQHPPSSHPRRRWPRAVAAASWVVVTVLLGLQRLYVYRIGTGLEPRAQLSATVLRDAAATMLAAGVLLAAGPLGLWLAGRRRGWLVVAVVVFLLACVLAGRDLADSFGAPAVPGG